MKNMKATAIAPSNVALIKYWGKQDEALRIPTNSSISINLSGMATTTTVAFLPGLKEDEVLIDGRQKHSSQKRVSEQLDRFRKLANVFLKARVVSQNSFPAETGLSSSASGFAALTVAIAFALGLRLEERALSVFSRQASGSACRSIPNGFVEWERGDSSESSYAHSIHPADWWNIYDIVLVLNHKSKEIPTTDGQRYAATSPFFKSRLKGIDNKISELKKMIREKNFPRFGEIVESEAIEFHAIAMTSTPSLIYWYPETLFIMHQVRKWRQDGLSVYFTINTGHNLHIFCHADNFIEVKKRVSAIPTVKKIIVNKPARGAHLIDKHLF